ncbi:hypothetical protein [Desertimonas flava]|uniref:hypothetical protein n=1 Tax=Desertimonas flava TaxID=2064846 RepID=UPI0013C41E9B|nr:hypothetical protein [Desertimonas flava]
MRRRGIGVTLVATFAVVAGPALATAAAAPDPARHVDSATIQLPAAPAVGQTARLAVMVDSEIVGSTTAGPLSVDLGVSREVTGVDANTGAYSTRSVMEDIAVGQAPPGFDVSVLESVRSMSVLQQFDATGAPLGPGVAENAVSDEQSDGGRRLMRLMAVTTVGYPSEPVAVGASWSSSGTASDTSGISVDVVYQCRLVAVEGRTFTIEVSFAQDFSIADPLHGQIDATISGQGTLQGSLDNVLLVSGAITQTVDGVTTSNGVTTPLSADSSIQIAPA